MTKFRRTSLTGALLILAIQVPNLAQAQPGSTRQLAPSDLAQALGSGTPQPTLDAPASTEPLALAQAVRQALGRHPTIADALATLSQQESGVEVARAGYYPQMRLGVTGGRNNGVASTNANLREGTLATATVSQMLYDFGKVAGAVNQSEALVHRQQAVVLKQIDTISQETAQAVIEVHRYQALLKIAKDQVAAVEKILETARLRANASLSPQADPIQAESRVDNARANYLDVKAQYAQAREHLRTLLGGPVPQSLADLPDQIGKELDMNKLPDLNLLPDVLMARAELRASEAQLDVAKAQVYPTLSLDASVNRSFGGMNPNTYTQDGTYHSIGLNLSSTLFQGGAQKGQISAAAAAAEAARQRIEVAQLNASDEARSFRERALGAQERLNVLAARKRSIIEARDLYKEQYTLGTRSILDLLNAEQEIYQAAAEEEVVRNDFWQDRIGFIGATGQARKYYGLDNTSIQGLEVRQ